MKKSSALLGILSSLGLADRPPQGKRVKRKPQSQKQKEIQLSQAEAKRLRKKQKRLEVAARQNQC